MRDYGLLISAVAAFAVPAVVARWRWQLTTVVGPEGFLDVALLPTGVGLAVSRLTAMALDDPRSLTSLPDVLVIRSGVEFWPGLLAATGIAAWSARRRRVGPLVRLGDIAAPAMLGYATYEAACVIRDGCYGPFSSVGLRPDGLQSTMLPVGLIVAAAVAGSAMAVKHLERRTASPSCTVAVAIATVATIRAVSSFWLPKVGDDLTRQHRSSLIIGALALVVALALAGVQRARKVAA